MPVNQASAEMGNAPKGAFCFSSGLVCRPPRSAGARVTYLGYASDMGSVNSTTSVRIASGMKRWSMGGANTH